MAKDILVNTNTGNVKFDSTASRERHYEVVWGRLFDDDSLDYMNIVIPASYINNIDFTSGEYCCIVKASYNPSNKRVIARLVVKESEGVYSNISKYTSNAPGPSTCMYYPLFSDGYDYFRPCNAPLIDTSGSYIVIFKRYAGSNFTMAFIHSSSSPDFNIGNSESQESQLLTRCAPGSMYRYPTTGVDLTKYINSVVENTDLTDKLISEFANDGKEITDAEFDSATGQLQVSFSGDSSETDTNLTDPNDLDTSVFDNANDDFVRKTIKAMNSVCDNDGFIDNLQITSDYVGIYDVGNMAEIEHPSATLCGKGYINEDGEFEEDDDVSTSVYSITLTKGRIYADCYNKSNYVTTNRTNRTYSWKPLFSIWNDDELVYMDEASGGSVKVFKYSAYISKNINRICFIPLVSDLKLYFVTKSSNEETIELIKNIDGNYASLIGLVHSKTTGQLMAITSSDTFVQTVKEDLLTNKIIAIKQ